MPFLDRPAPDATPSARRTGLLTVLARLLGRHLGRRPWRGPHPSHGDCSTPVTPDEGQVWEVLGWGPTRSPGEGDQSVRRAR